MTSAQTMTISQLARRAGVGVETIRYYQRIGLIEEPAKPEQGYRTYPNETLARLHFILRAKELGFSLKEITDLLSLDGGDCSQTQQIANNKLEGIRSKIADLTSMADILEQLLASCQRNDASNPCPIIDVLKYTPPKT